LPHNAEADVVTFYEGVVSKVNVMVGSSVKKGHTLAIVASPEFIKKQMDYLAAKNELDLWEKEYERQEALNRDNISSDKQFQKVKADYLEAKTVHNALRIEMELLGVDKGRLEEGMITERMLLKSPINGIVEEISINIGKYIKPGQTLFKIVDRSELLVELMVFEKDIMKIKKGQRIDFSLGNLSSQLYETHISAISGNVKSEAKVILALAEFSNINNELLPGMFVSAKIHTEENYLDALPEDAVIFDGEANYHIYYTIPSLMNKDHVAFKKASVERGFVEEGYAQVILLDTIPSEAKIVVSGSYYIYSAELQGED
jgi:cobalt-zinc-cadmium efflux system membrane fusion protein